MQQLGVFARFWAPGDVKTRLAATEGPQGAADLYRAFLETTLRRFERSEWHPVVAFTPPDHREEFLALAGPGWRLEPQANGDLGARMRHYFQTALDAGFRRVVLIGSDSPTLPVELVEAAFEALNAVPVVLGPSTDGGYYLVGVAEQIPDIFSEMAWGSAAVWSETINRLAAAGTPFARLESWYDVDDRADLQRLRNELARDQSDPVLLRLREALQQIPPKKDNR